MLGRGEPLYLTTGFDSDLVVNWQSVAVAEVLEAQQANTFS